MMKHNVAIYTQIARETKAVRRRLIKKVAEKGLYENFGQVEVRKLRTKYAGSQYGNIEHRRAYQLIDQFDDWCMSYTGRSNPLTHEKYSTREGDSQLETERKWKDNPKSSADISRDVIKEMKSAAEYYESSYNDDLRLKHVRRHASIAIGHYYSLTGNEQKALEGKYPRTIFMMYQLPEYWDTYILDAKKELKIKPRTRCLNCGFKMTGKEKKWSNYCQDCQNAMQKEGVETNPRTRQMTLRGRRNPKSHNEVLNLIKEHIVMAYVHYRKGNAHDANDWKHIANGIYRTLNEPETNHFLKYYPTVAKTMDSTSATWTSSMVKKANVELKQMTKFKNPTKQQAVAKAGWHRKRGIRARVIPTASGYSAYIDGKSKRLKKRAIKAKAKPKRKAKPKIVKPKRVKVKAKPRPKPKPKVVVPKIKPVGRNYVVGTAKSRDQAIKHFRKSDKYKGLVISRVKALERPTAKRKGKYQIFFRKSKVKPAKPKARPVAKPEVKLPVAIKARTARYIHADDWKFHKITTVAYDFTYKGIKMFAHSDIDKPKTWAITERSTGAAVCKVGGDVKLGVAIEHAVKEVNKIGVEKLKTAMVNLKKMQAKEGMIPTTVKPKPAVKAKPKPKAPAKPKPAMPKYKKYLFRCSGCGAHGALDVRDDVSVELERGVLQFAKCPDCDPAFYAKTFREGRYKSPIIHIPGKKSKLPKAPRFITPVPKVKVPAKPKKPKLSEAGLADIITRKLEEMMK